MERHPAFINLKVTSQPSCARTHTIIHTLTHRHAGGSNDAVVRILRCKSPGQGLESRLCLCLRYVLFHMQIPLRHTHGRTYTYIHTHIYTCAKTHTFIYVHSKMQTRGSTIVQLVVHYSVGGGVEYMFNMFICLNRYHISLPVFYLSICICIISYIYICLTSLFV